MSSKEPDPDESSDTSFSDEEFWALAELASGSNDSDVTPGDPDEPEVAKGIARALVLSQIDAPAALSAGLSMVGASAPVIQVSQGSAVIMEVEQNGPSDEEELAMLLGDDRPIPDSVDKMASLVSKMTEGGAVALTSWTSSEKEGTEGTIVARRYINGKPEQKLSAGLVLAGLDPVCEELLLGRLTPEEADAISKRGRWTGWMRGPGFRP
ncbi:hypothetical protein U6G28_08030 [Actinomycetaceae bacterium MB13-C1-2]|nr:hypothetical protein U6G28_08030 [Actinomycetaceae bacterium MB13-C1-2]